MAIRKGSSYKDRPIHEKTIGSKAFEHALDIELMIIDRMEELGLRRKDLAERVGMTQSGLSNFLNGQPNMTIETMTRFEVALDAVFEITLRPENKYTFSTGIVEDCSEERFAIPDKSSSSQPLKKRSYRLRACQSEESMCSNAETIGKPTAVLSDKERCAA